MLWTRDHTTAQHEYSIEFFKTANGYCELLDTVFVGYTCELYTCELFSMGFDWMYYNGCYKYIKFSGLNVLMVVVEL